MKIRLDGWKQNMNFSACHFIPNHNKCGNLHGHSYGVHIELEGEPDEDDVLLDFSIVKGHIREFIELVDHRLMLPTLNQDIEIGDMGEAVEIVVGRKRYVIPREDVALLEITSSSAEMLAAYFARELGDRLKAFGNIREISVGVEEGPGQGALYTVKLR